MKSRSCGGPLGVIVAAYFLTILSEAASNKNAITRAAGSVPHCAGARPKLLSKEFFLRYAGRRRPATGFITYISKTKPVLMHCHGWEDYSDGYDDYAVSLSYDNGKTWTADTVHWK